MIGNEENIIRQEVLALIKKAGIPLSAADYGNVSVVDFGLGALRTEGCQYIDIFRTPRMRITILVLLPGQTLPQHRHPPLENHPGKEENVRAVQGELRLYLPGPDTMIQGFVVDGKEQYYSVRNERIMVPGDGYTITPDVEHWFQAGPYGAVSFGFYPAVDESRNVFADPDIICACGSRHVGMETMERG